MAGGALTFGLVGGTGKSGRWALKAALVRGMKVRMLGRTPAKVQTVLSDLFPGDAELGSQAALETNGRLVVVKGSTPVWAEGGKLPDGSQKMADGSDAAAAMMRDSVGPLKEMMAGCDVVMSFLGITVPKKGKPGWAVRPGIEAILTAASELGEQRPRLVLHQTSICLNDSWPQGKKAYGGCGLIAPMIRSMILKDCFADMEASETWVFENRAKLGVNTTVLRPAVLDGGKYEKNTYVKDYAARVPGYTLLKSDALSKKEGVTFYCGRQHVAEAFLDIAEAFCKGSESYTNTEWSVFDKK